MRLELVDNQELNQLVVSNFDNLIIPNIGAIVDILDEFIRNHLINSNKDSYILIGLNMFLIQIFIKCQSI